MSFSGAQSHEKANSTLLNGDRSTCVVSNNPCTSTERIHSSSYSGKATSPIAIGLVALPEYDEEWIRSVDVQGLLDTTQVERSPLRSVEFAFSCDCAPEKLIPYFQALSTDALKELYGADEELHITCPRCGKQFAIHRRDLMPEQ